MKRTLTLTLFILTLYSFQGLGQTNSLDYEELKYFSIDQKVDFDQILSSNDADFLGTKLSGLSKTCKTPEGLPFVECTISGLGIELLTTDDVAWLLKITDKSYNVFYKDIKIAIGDDVSQIAIALSRPNLKAEPYPTEIEPHNKHIVLHIGDWRSVSFDISSDNKITEITLFHYL